MDEFIWKNNISSRSCSERDYKDVQKDKWKKSHTQKFHCEIWEPQKFKKKKKKVLKASREQNRKEQVYKTLIPPEWWQSKDRQVHAKFTPYALLHYKPWGKFPGNWGVSSSTQWVWARETWRIMPWWHHARWHFQDMAWSRSGHGGPGREVPGRKMVWPFTEVR